MWEVYSAGLEAGGLHPYAVAVMAEAGVDISRQASKTLDPALLDTMDLVITVCGEAEERCPLTPPHVRRLHWPCEDPARARGTEEEVMAAFRQVRDVLRARIAALAEEHRLPIRDGFERG
jgi:arsenate reductase